MERSGSEGTIHVSNSGYMENDAMCPERTYILSGVFGRPEKGRRAEEPVPNVPTSYRYRKAVCRRVQYYVEGSSLDCFLEWVEDFP